MTLIPIQNPTRHTKSTANYSNFDDSAAIERKLYLAGLGIIVLAAITLMLSDAARISNWHAVFESQFLLVIPLYASAAWLLHREINRVLPRHDPFLLPIATLFAGIGLLTLWRLSPGFAQRQSIWFILAVALVIVVSRLPADLNWLRNYRMLWLVTGLALITIALVFGTSPSGTGPRLWLSFGEVFFQPSEPLRLLLLAYLAAYYARHMPFSWQGIRNILPTIAPLFLVGGLAIGLLIAQRDLGTAVLFLGMLSLLFFLASERWQILPLTALLILLSGFLGYELFDVVQVRIDAWINPWLDPLGGSFQIIQSLISFAAGGILGSGPGMGSPGFVPAAHTDFIFTAISEEWGLIGSVSLIAMYAILIQRSMRIAVHQTSQFPRLFAAGLTLMMGLQTIMILGGTTRLLPLTGITLPFVSYGGSSLLTNFIALGLLLLLSSQQSNSAHIPRSYHWLQISFLIAFGILAFVVTWWTVIKAPELLARDDNFRRALTGRYIPRGRILDQNGRVLAESVGISGDITRDYPYDSLSPILGYDTVFFGQSGLEHSMDIYLRGETGYDIRTEQWAKLTRNNPPPGLDIRLTIDIDMQNTLYSSLRDQRGAAVVVSTDSGRILAMLSTPSFSAGNLAEEWESLSQRADAPLLNRSLQGTYQPGTILTPLVYAWQIEQGAEIPKPDDTSFQVPVVIDQFVFECAEQLGKNENTWTAAVSEGCPQAGLLLSNSMQADDFSELLSAYGFFMPLNINLPEAKPAEPPNADYNGVLPKTVLGQGSVTVTPLHVARAFMVLLHGQLLPLQLIDSTLLPNGQWQAYPITDPVVEILSQASLNRLNRDLFSGPNDVVEFSGQAITGSDPVSLGWYVAAFNNGESQLLVLLLEEQSAFRTRIIGQNLLEEMALPADENIP